VFKLKPIENAGQKFLHKARCVVRADKQQAFIDYDPSNIYAPVVYHEALRLILALSAYGNLILEAGDIANAYLYGTLNVPIIIQQPTNSSGLHRYPDMDCVLLKSMYGLKQAGEIWGALLSNSLLSWGFKVSKYDRRVYLIRNGHEFVIMAVVVDDIEFSANSRTLLEQIKEKLAATFDVKLLGVLRSFIGWELVRTSS